MIFFLTLLTIASLNAQTGFDGLTYAQRKQRWLANVPDPTPQMSDFDRRLYFSAWLEKGLYNQTVSETLHDILGAFWFTGGRSHHGYLAALLVKFGSKGSNVISKIDEAAIKRKYEENLIKNAEAFQDFNPNKQIWTMVGIYIYTTYFDNKLTFPFYGHPVTSDATEDAIYSNNWPTFSIGGHTYLFGKGPYNASQLAEDFIKHKLATWYLEGNREFDSLNYHRAYMGALLMLYDFARDNQFRNQAKMGAELVMLDALLDFGNSEWGGTLGRTDFRRTSKNSNFPIYEYFGIGQKDTERPDINVLFSFDYEPPELFVDLANLSDENDDYYHFHKERHDAKLKNDRRKGKWNYVTPHYNIGSNVGGLNSGWQVTVRGDAPGKFIRFWINGQADIADTTETRYLGNEGKQFRNALFADIGSQPKLHERKRRQEWQIDEVDGKWLFKKLNPVFVAISMTSSTASVELATLGVEYPSYTEFKKAVKNNARLTTKSYTTSQGITINSSDNCGLYAPGDCTFPFKRMETVYKNGSIITWFDNVMTVSYHGKSLEYDFRSLLENIQTTRDRAPNPPSNVKVQTHNN
ncbi:MAG: hypothetical protein ACE5HS_02845 [bacterium]